MHYAHEHDWPGVDTAAERRKILSGGRLYKFEGLGSSGRAARHRAAALAAEGISLDPIDEGDGWLSYPWVGQPMHASDLDVALIEHIARYCARRPSLCPAHSTESDLEPVVEHNLAQLLGSRRRARPLTVTKLVTPDGHLCPHEWLALEDRAVRKTDGISHGDDLFFPGPTDIAWDLAGAIVEWRMDRGARDHFLAAYRRASGDDASSRIDAWIEAYTTLRAAMTQFALERAAPAEVGRLTRDLDRYSAALAAP